MTSKVIKIYYSYVWIKNRTSIIGWSEAIIGWSEAINFYILVRFWCCTVGHCTVHDYSNVCGGGNCEAISDGAGVSL
jgi:hypothetical protein